MKLYQITITFPGADPYSAGLLREVLTGMGVSLGNIVETMDIRSSGITVYFRLKQARDRIRKRILSLGLLNARVRTSGVDEKNWVKKCALYNKPFTLNGDIRVIPAKPGARFKAACPGERTIRLFINNVFGSGRHFTTCRLALFLKTKKGDYASVMDVGSGTGLLCLVAGIYGAREVWAIDIDKEAVKTALANFRLNKRSGFSSIAGDFYKFKKKKKFDMVIANLFTRDLVALRDKLIGHVNGGKYLAVSGISRGNYKYFRENFDSPELKCLRVEKDKEWCAVLYRRKA
ncbi:MAG: 50S ribosomal protein L11 methyltransferase [Candidatus Omnitrophica bacterium]|nr:50S ribosomal protein L11 methyltransferase [Candidatus Omnitrophota bacterium]